MRNFIASQKRDLRDALVMMAYFFGFVHIWYYVKYPGMFQEDLPYLLFRLALALMLLAMISIPYILGYLAGSC